MLKVGITGGIGSGKSTVCRIFQQLGIPVYDSDQRAKMLMVENEKVIAAITKTFGKEAYSNPGELNRKHIADIVFNQPEKLELLNGIVHPAVFEDFRNWVAEQTDVPYVIKEAALMFESGSYKELDVVVNVNAPVEVRVKRVLLRDKGSEEEIRKRMANQWSDEERTAKANYIINNDEMEMLLPQVLRLHQIFISG